MAAQREFVECFTDGSGLFFSKTHHNRCVKRLPLGGYAMYEKEGNDGTHRGVCSLLGAYQWLNGEPEEAIDGRLFVFTTDTGE